MTAKDLIAKLQLLVKEHGDCEVLVATPDPDGPALWAASVEVEYTETVFSSEPEDVGKSVPYFTITTHE